MPTLRAANKSIYWAWKSMKQRCQNPRCAAYRNYGARGIKVCDAWQVFEPFCEWALSHGYEPGLDLDRADNDGDYTPDNCRWITRRKNINNRRNTILISVDGVTRPRSEWETIAHIPYGTVKKWVEDRGTDYAAYRIKEALKNGYVGGDYKRNHVLIPVMCMETGESFPSINAAARAHGLNVGALVGAIKRNGTAGGKHYVREEINE